MERTMARPSPVPPTGARTAGINAVKAIKDPLQMGRGDSPKLVTAKVTFGPSGGAYRIRKKTYAKVFRPVVTA